MRILSIVIVIFFSWVEIDAQEIFQDWPAGYAPREVGVRVTDRFLEKAHGVYDAYDAKPHVPYFEVCTWYGGLTFANVAGDETRARRLEERFAPLMHEDTAMLPVADHVDYTMFGSLPFELYLQTGKQEYITLGLRYADAQWGPPFGPRVTPASQSYLDKGLTWQTRLWIDDMYMITIVQAQAYRCTGDVSYLDNAAREMIFYLDSLQRPNGLFYHAPDVPFYWSRGNGWMAAGMTELLRVLPEEHEAYTRILGSYRKMMQTLLSLQTESGMWRQLLNDTQSWEESSGTGMFTFALVTGIKNGWLDARQFGEAARKGWLALVEQINTDGDVMNVCEGTGKKNDHQYYLNRKRNTGDFHGQAPVLWAATALLRAPE